MGSSISTSSPTLVLFCVVFLYYSHPTDIVSPTLMVLTCISLLTNDIEHFFICILAIPVSCFVRNFLYSFAYLSIGLFVFLKKFLYYKSSLYILDKTLIRYDLQIYSPILYSYSCLFTFLIVPLTQFLNSDEINLFFLLLLALLVS